MKGRRTQMVRRFASKALLIAGGTGALGIAQTGQWTTSRITGQLSRKDFLLNHAQRFAISSAILPI
jgi:hypothetical protein